MILQSDEFSCGAVAVVNAMEAIGVDYAVEAMAKMCRTSPVHGTSEKDIIKALVTLEHPVREIGESSTGFALVILRGYLAGGASAILAVDQDSHWIAAIGLCGNRFIIHDSACGTSSMSDTELLARWRKERAKMPFYGIAIQPRRRR